MRSSAKEQGDGKKSRRAEQWESGAKRERCYGTEALYNGPE